MGMRIVPNIFATMQAAVAQDQQNLNTALQQVSTGQSVNTLSDNPLAASQLVGNRTELSSTDQFLHSISYVQGAMQTADSALNSVSNYLNQAISLATEGANGTMSSSDEQAIAQEVSSIQQSILGLANSSYQGSYLFGGTATVNPPYVQSSSSSSGVAYNGNSNVNQVQIGPSQFASINLPGSTIFNASGADVFQALSNLTNALKTNGNVTGALSEVSAAFQNVNMQRTFYGNTLQQLNSANNTLTSEQFTLQQDQNSLIAANPATAISNMDQANYTLQAALQAFAKISQNTLMDYIK